MCTKGGQQKHLTKHTCNDKSRLKALAKSLPFGAADALTDEITPPESATHPSHLRPPISVPAHDSDMHHLWAKRLWSSGIANSRHMNTASQVATESREEASHTAHSINPQLAAKTLCLLMIEIRGCIEITRTLQPVLTTRNFCNCLAAQLVQLKQTCTLQVTEPTQQGRYAKKRST